MFWTQNASKDTIGEGDSKRMKVKKKDGILLGLAMFAMFFGSGNVIFPPFLGLECGPQWLVGVLSYMISDIFIAMLIFVAVARIDGDVNSIARRLGEVPGKLVISIAMICIGPLFCIPRAAATTFDMVLTPLTGAKTGSVTALIFIIAFFLLTYVLAVKPNNVCDIIGKYLTPALILFIVCLVIKGILTPIAPFSEKPMVDNVVQRGVIAGYQSMEVLGGLSVVPIFMAAVKDKGYVEKKLRVKAIVITTFVCLLCLLAAGVGMTYLGATVSTLYDNSISQAILVVKIANHLFGNVGGIILGLLAGVACLITSVALTSGTAKYFSEIYPKLSYRRIIQFCCLFGVVIAYIGLKNIIAVAVPILTLLYPLVVAMVVLSLFNDIIQKDAVFKGVAIGTLVIGVLSMLNSLGINLQFVEMIPFFETGLGWILPAVIGGIIGQIIGKQKVLQTN